MNKKDYELIARAFSAYAECDSKVFAHLAEARYEPEPEHRARAVRINLLAHTLADSMAQDNPRFKKDFFIKACGL